MSSGLVVRGLRARYARGPEVLRGLDFEAPRGAVTALLGPNGSGKSTLLKAVLGLLPSEGTLELDGVDPRALSLPERARTLAYVPQRTQLAAQMTVRAVVELGRFGQRGAFASTNAEDARAVEQALHEADAEAFAERPFRELSGGEQQRVLLARALATGARTLLLDEPTSSQDVRHVLEMHAALRALAARGHAIAIVLHDLNEARRHVDRAVLLQAGRVHASGPVRSVVEAGAVRAVYGVELVEGAGLGYERVAAREGAAR